MTPLTIGVQPESGDLAARRSEPRKAGSVPGARAGSPPVPDDGIDLAPLLETVFDPDLDRLIYEVLDFGGVARLPSDPAVKDRGGAPAGHRHSRRMYRASGTGLLTALGCVDARERIGGRRWIVLACDGSPPDALMKLLNSRKPESLGRFMLVQRIDGACQANEGQWKPGVSLPPAGWRLYCLPESAQADEFRNALRELSSVDDAPVMVLVPRSSTRLPQAPRPCGSNEFARCAPAEIEERLIDKLLQAMAADHRVVPIITIDGPPWRRLLDEEPQNCVSLAPDELETAIPWCAALADSGCHPVVVMGQDSLHQRASEIVRELSGVGRTATLIVRNLPSVICDDSEAGDSQYGAATSLPYLAGASLSAPQHTEEAVQALEQSFRTACTSVLWMPGGPVSGRPRNAARANRGPGLADELILSGLSAGPVNLFGGSTATSAFQEFDQPRPAAVPGARLQDRPYAVSPETAQSDQQAIRNKSLRPDVWRWLNEYNHVGLRDLYLWRWCLHGIELTTIPSVPTEWLQHVHDTKLLSVILCVLFDDVADRRGRTEFLELLLDGHERGASIETADLTEPERKYVEITRHLWDEYESRVRRYPLSAEYSRLLKFDLLQFSNTMRYAHLVNAEPGLLSPTEHDVYTPHNMLMVSFSTIDLMCSAGFERHELGTLREAMWHAQSMGRIGNILSTWRRELSDADYSNGLAMRADMAAPESRLRPQPSEPSPDIDSRHMERQLLAKWEWHRSRCHAAARSVRSIDLAGVLEGHDRFLDMHLISTGLI